MAETHFSRGDRLARNEHLRVDVVEEPLEGLAMEIGEDLLPVRHVSHQLLHKAIQLNN